jgi:hypothetical protein
MKQSPRWRNPGSDGHMSRFHPKEGEKAQE